MSSLRGLNGVVRSACEQLLGTLFGETIASALISFENPPVTLRSMKKLLKLHNPKAPDAFRTEMQTLVGKHDVNAPFSDDVCRWLNGHRDVIPTADQQLDFSPESATLCSFSVWTGDIFCVELSLMAGGTVSWDAANPPFTISKAVRRCLAESDEIWSPFAARGMEVAGQGEAFLGKGGFADVFRSSFRNQGCAAKRFRNVFTALPLDKIDSLMTEILLLCRVRPCKHIVKCKGFFLWDVQFPTMKPCFFLELMDVALDKLLAGRPMTALPINTDVVPEPKGCDYDAYMAVLDNRLDILKQLAAAVQYLHASSPPIVHRDIKPANVLLTTETTDDGAVNVIAKLTTLASQMLAKRCLKQ